jgi:hypothetical protein
LPFRERFRAWFLRPNRRRWLRIALWTTAAFTLLFVLVTAIFWVRYARIIDAKLGTEQKPVPRIYGRPFELRAGRGLVSVIQRLNDVAMPSGRRSRSRASFRSPVRR